jgi:hypothetical protein
VAGSDDGVRKRNGFFAGQSIGQREGFKRYGYWLFHRFRYDHGVEVIKILLLLVLLLLLLLKLKFFSLVAFERMLLEEKRKMISVLSSATIFFQASAFTRCIENKSQDELTLSFLSNRCLCNLT